MIIRPISIDPFKASILFKKGFGIAATGKTPAK